MDIRKSCNPKYPLGRLEAKASVSLGSSYTSLAHLAGALGRPVSILLSFAPDWRWLLERSDTPWYPTATLHRQDRPGDWDSALQKALRLIRAEDGLSTLGR
jgi:hypothetical protein